MSDFNDIINKILKTPPPLSAYLPPLLLPLLPAPSAASILSVPAGLVPPLGRCSHPLRPPPPVVSSGDIWDVPSLEKEQEDKDKDKEDKEDKEDKDNNMPTSGPRYIIEFNIQCLMAIANTII